MSSWRRSSHRWATRFDREKRSYVQADIAALQKFPMRSTSLAAYRAALNQLALDVAALAVLIPPTPPPPTPDPFSTDF